MEIAVQLQRAGVVGDSGRTVLELVRALTNMPRPVPLQALLQLLIVYPCAAERLHKKKGV